MGDLAIRRDLYAYGKNVGRNNANERIGSPRTQAYSGVDKAGKVSDAIDAEISKLQSNKTWLMRDEWIKQVKAPNKAHGVSYQVTVKGGGKISYYRGNSPESLKNEIRNYIEADFANVPSANIEVVGIDVVDTTLEIGKNFMPYVPVSTAADDINEACNYYSFDNLKDYRELFDEARDAENRGDRSEANKKFRELLKEEYSETRIYNYARKALSKVSKGEGEVAGADSLLRKLWNLYFHNRYEEAIIVALKLEKNYPNTHYDLWAKHIRGRIYCETNKKWKAFHLFIRIIDKAEKLSHGENDPNIQEQLAEIKKVTRFWLENVLHEYPDRIPGYWETPPKHYLPYRH